jgi:hypothetical protein
MYPVPAIVAAQYSKKPVTTRLPEEAIRVIQQWKHGELGWLGGQVTSRRSRDGRDHLRGEIARVENPAALVAAIDRCIRYKALPHQTGANESASYSPSRQQDSRMLRRKVNIGSRMLPAKASESQLWMMYTERRRQASAIPLPSDPQGHALRRRTMTETARYR